MITPACCCLLLFVVCGHELLCCPYSLSRSIRNMRLILVILLLTLLANECAAIKSRGKLAGKKPLRRQVSFDEDDEEEDEPKYKKKKSKSFSKPIKKNPKAQLVRWGDNKKKSKPKPPTISLKERIESLASQGQNVYKSAFRQVKAMRSSAFESMLLKATWPNDEPVPNEFLTEIIRHSIPAFKYGRSSASDDPYHMTMHKLWMKMNEKDYRTILKSLYILHLISRDSSKDVCDRFGAAVKDMMKSRNPKNPDQRYFDLDEISIVDKTGETFADFIYAYAEYVIYRIKTISGKSEELKQLDAKTSEKTAVATLKKAKQVITLGLRCSITDKKMVNLITGHILKALANDLRDIWKIFGAKLAPFVDQGTTPNPGPSASSEDIKNLLKFYQDKTKEINSFLSRSSKVFESLRMKLPTEVDSGILSSEKVAQKIESLTSIKGGFCESAVCVSKRLGDSDEEEEDDDEETDESEEEEEEDEEEEEAVLEDDDDEDEEDEEDKESEELEDEEDSETVADVADNDDDDNDDDQEEEVADAEDEDEAEQQDDDKDDDEEEEEDKEDSESDDEEEGGNEDSDDDDGDDDENNEDQDDDEEDEDEEDDEQDEDEAEDEEGDEDVDEDDEE